MKPYLSWYAGILTITFAVGLLAVREWNLQPDGRLHAYFLDVGQGDSALLVSPSGKQIVIDGGPDLSPLEHLGAYMPYFDREIELLVLSHPNLDHLAALPEILRRYRIDRVLITAVPYDMGRYQAMLSEIAQQGIPVTIAKQGATIAMDDGFTLSVLWPPTELLGKSVKLSKLNDTSIVLRAGFSGHSILFTGDMEEPVERALVKSGIDLHADILKVPHHGSHTSSGTGFLLAVHPSLAVISVGEGNSYGHPHREIMERYRALGIPVRLTKSGTVSISF